MLMRKRFPCIVLMLALSVPAAMAQADNGWWRSAPRCGVPAMSAADAMPQADNGHAKFHQWYRGLKSPEGQSCCNDKDCHPVEGRFVGKGAGGSFVLEIRVHGRWYQVPHDRILPQPSPDGGIHACYSDPAPFMTETSAGLIIRCVMIGGFS
jgi:hypothetical protein